MFKKLIGFTLAEVLIVIGILGVVATLTIPTVNNNINKHHYTTALKTISMSLSDKFRSQMAIEDVATVGDLRAFVNSTTSEEFLKELSEFMLLTAVDAPHEVLNLNGTVPNASQDYLKPVWQPKLMRRTSHGAFIHMLSYEPAGTAGTGDKAPLAIKARGGSLLIRYATICIDINGYKGPNRAGRDVFKFYLGQDGILYPAGGFDAGLWDLASPSLWRHSEHPDFDCIDEKSKGYGCAGRIEEDDWKMLY